ncbi:hypothetical protein VE03_01475 [Pseudogymnoascus sp. 23342-1-I1]|nr:hypothetical protein VE03_01475 [Pseudogymnoascus sp. 23342-1-I1]
MVDFKKLFYHKNHKTIRPTRPEYEDRNVQPRLPKTRKRALSLYEPGQQTSGLLLRLPIELRRRIYDEVLGHRKVHLLFEFAPRKDDRFRGIWFDRCKDGGVIKGNAGPPNGMMGKLKLDFAILPTCRQMYSEAIDILYSTTTFDFGTRQLLYEFPSLVLPQRFALISAIEMSWEFIGLGLSPINTEQTQLCQDMWAMLAAMPNLRHLKIAVAAHECPYPAPPDLKKVWLAPPKKLRKMDVFEVLVPLSYAKMFNFSVDEGSNFTLGSFPDIFTVQNYFGPSADT